MVFQNIGDFLDMVEMHPDEAFVRDNGTEAVVYDTERGAFLLLKGDFTGHPEQVARELRKTIQEQHPLKEAA
jgi:hypothetical protein